MIFFNKKKKKEDKNQKDNVDFYKINNEIVEQINKASFMQDYSIDMYRDFVAIEKNIKIKDNETKNSINNIKSFFEKISKDSFYLKKFLENTLESFNELSTDRVSLLKNNKFFYYRITKLLSQEKEKSGSNKGIILNTDVFRYGGDEFVGIISRDIGVEVIFFDLMYLNYFNDLMSYKGGDAAIYTSSRIIEETLRSFENRTTKTRNIIDTILQNFVNFKFEKENSILNKIILHVDAGYANDLEIKEIEEEYVKIIKDKKLKIDKIFSIEDKINSIIELSEIRASIQKKNSKLYLLTNLYKLSKKDDRVNNILIGYLSFTKNPFVIEKIIKSINENSKNDEEFINNIIEESKKLEQEKNSKILKAKNLSKEKLLLEIIFNKATANVPKIMPNISIEEVVKRGGID